MKFTTGMTSDRCSLEMGSLSRKLNGTVMSTLRRFLFSVLAIIHCAEIAYSQVGEKAEKEVRILIVVGPSDHPPGTHEAAAGGRLMKHCLENATNVNGIKADWVDAWPKDPRVLDAVSSVIFIGDTFPPQRMQDTSLILAQLDTMMARGCGITCVHYATGLWGRDVQPDGKHPLLGWLGGYFANKTCPHHKGIAQIYPAATITPARGTHPIMRGWKQFTLHDEPYINNYFGQDENRLASNVTELASSMLPPSDPKKEIVSWCVEREDSGRGFAIVMPHFYKNWAMEDLRCFILNGIVWTAKMDVPAEGVKSTLPDLQTFKPASMEARRNN
jgi:type 1 glutamine amidotransferase